MSEWKDFQLTDLFEVQIGGTPSRGVKHYWANENQVDAIPWVSIADMFSNNTIIKSKESITIDGFNHSNVKLIPKGTLLFSFKLTIGRVAFSGIELTTNEAIAALIPKRTNVASELIYYILPKLLDSIIYDTAVKGKTLNKKKIAAITFNLPNSLSEQRKIARILSTVDAVIEKTEAAITKYKAIKQGMMRDLFTRGLDENGRLRPRYEDAPHLYQHTELGWVPKEWEVKKLGTILLRYGGHLQTGPFGSQLHAQEYLFEGVPVVMPQDINDGLIGTEQIARIDERRANDLARHRMVSGDVVIARRGDLSRAAAITESEQGWVCGTGCFLLRLKQSSLKAGFAAYVYRQDFVQRQIAGTAVGSTMPSLNNSVMSELVFPFCDEGEQGRIVQRLEKTEQYIRIHRKILATNQKLKQGLMSDLLTGKKQVRVEKG